MDLEKASHLENCAVAFFKELENVNKQTLLDRGIRNIYARKDENRTMRLAAIL